MSRWRRRDVPCLVAFLVALVLFLPHALWPEAPLYQSAWMAALLRYVGGLTKLFFLAWGAVFASRNVGRFGPANVVRPAWKLLAAALSLYAVGQLILVFYQLVLAIPLPFPSPADAFFVPSMLLMVLAVVAFLDVYRRVGFPFDLGRDLLLTGGLAAVVLASAGVLLLRPVVSGEQTGMALWLNLVYPISDLVLLVPTVILLRITWRFRGGQVWKTWISLVFGFLALAGGDIAFAYLSEHGDPRLEALADLLFLVSYITIARGVLYQDELLDG